MSFQEIQQIRKELKYTWRHFFRRFGKLLPAQLEAIPRILNGENVIIMSPTASGKTEAVLAPFTELIKRKDLPQPNTIYISPTRALVYDIYYRFSQIIEDLGLSIAVRTGERKQFSLKNPQDILLTTPESLDSMLCRNNDVLKNIKHVILDELHLIHGNYRGDQLKLDLVRLSQITDTLQYGALSATFSDPYQVAKHYFPTYSLVQTGDARKINYKMFYFKNELNLKEVLQYCRSKQYRKILFFCNSRAKTEVIADMLKSLKIWPEKNIFVHHGSLSKGERDDAEAGLKFEHAVLCCATTTLEVGIDIGDIDCTVLIEPPLSVSSLLQRIGRGNRRSNQTNTIGLYSNDAQFEEFNLIFMRAELGQIEEIENGPCLSVVVQQILSYVFQNRRHGVSSEDLRTLILQLPTSEDIFVDILEKLVDEEYLTVTRDLIKPATRLMDIAQYGFIHSNIPGGNELKVIDEVTGRPIGNIEKLESINRDFMLSGKKWQVVSVGRDSIKVNASNIRNVNPAVFPGVKTHGKYYNWLPPTAKEVCCNPVIE